MQIPKRKSQALRQKDESTTPVYLTEKGLEDLKNEIKQLETVDELKARKDVSEAVQKGDLSENAEYHEARGRLTRIQNRLVLLKEKIKRVQVIQKDSKNQSIQLGSIVVLEKNGEKKTYELVGPDEVDISKKRISFLSPLGKVLMSKSKGDYVSISSDQGEISYLIKDIK